MRDRENNYFFSRKSLTNSQKLLNQLSQVNLRDHQRPHCGERRTHQSDVLRCGPRQIQASSKNCSEGKSGHHYILNIADC